MCLPWRQGSIPARVREEGKGVRIREPQYTQGCKKIERAAVQVNYRRTNLLRRGLQIRQKVGFFRPKRVMPAWKQEWSGVPRRRYLSEGLSCCGLLLTISHNIESSINRTLKGEWLNTRIHLLNSFIRPPDLLIPSILEGWLHYIQI